MDKSKLKAQMALNNDTGIELSKYLQISQTSLSRKLNGESEFTQNEIFEIKQRYHLTPEQIDEIFFRGKVS